MGPAKWDNVGMNADLQGSVYEVVFLVTHVKDCVKSEALGKWAKRMLFRGQGWAKAYPGHAQTRHWLEKSGPGLPS